MNQSNGIKRSRSNAMIGGVCAGIAGNFGWSVTGTRVAYVLLSIISAAFPGILVYLILWLVLPSED
jgi:phage shock protein PspC (stress-responsive transcriptional regulator)